MMASRNVEPLIVSDNVMHGIRRWLAHLAKELRVIGNISL